MMSKLRCEVTPCCYTQADAAVGKVADAFAFLHPNVDGACNLSFIDEGLRWYVREDMLSYVF